MPLNDTAMPVESPAGKEWKPLPEDVYQAVIKDVDEKIMNKFQSEEQEAFYHFKFVVLDAGDLSGSMVSTFCTRKWFAGNQRTKPSKLVNLVKAVYGYYYPKLSVTELEADEMTVGVINDLIGKQIRIAVKLNNAGDNNKISDFMAIKEELEVPEDVVLPSVAKKYLAKPSEEKVSKKDTKTDDDEASEEEDASDMPF